MKNKIKYKIFKILTLIVILSLNKISFAQNVSVSSALDSTLMFIGGQMNFLIEVVQPAELYVEIPHFPDTITQNIEVVRYSKSDTIRNGEILTISRLYRITSFDSGLHYVPPIEVEYRVGELVEKQESQPHVLNVINPFLDVDPEKGFFDIKQPFTLPFRLSEIVWVIKWVVLAIIVAILLFFGVRWWIGKRNPIKEIFFREKPKEPPHIIALRGLDKIKNEKIWLKGQIKQYYSQLSDVLRVYMEGRFNFLAMEQTTPEILKDLKLCDLPDTTLIQRMSYILETADLAKFAKYEPIPDENDNCLQGAYIFVEQTKVEEVVNE